MREQLLDEMDIERERGITIKANAVRIDYQSGGGSEYEFNIIDTPGHVDFSYEVSRSLEACEGALLLVDASQGVEAQTLANAYLAIESGLEVIPVVNKIDLPAADPDRVAGELVSILGGSEEEVVWVSAKSGTGIDELLEIIVERRPSQEGISTARCVLSCSIPTTTPTVVLLPSSELSTVFLPKVIVSASWHRMQISTQTRSVYGGRQWSGRDGSRLARLAIS